MAIRHADFTIFCCKSRAIMGGVPTHKRVASSTQAGSAIVAWLALNSGVAGPSSIRGWHALLPSLRNPLLVALAYYLGAEAAFLIGTLSDKIFALFWPPNVVLFCALMFVSQRRWWLYILAVFAAHAIAEHGVGMPVPQMLVAFATNCMVALLNAYAVRRFVGGPPWFGSFQKATNYVLITAGLSPGLSAFGGAFVPILGGGALQDYW